MNYIDNIKSKLQEKFEFSGEYIGLLDEYSLLVATVGENCTNENVHDAWSVWQNRTNSIHRSLIPYSELTKEVQDLDTQYKEVIIAVSRDINHV